MCDDERNVAIDELLGVCETVLMWITPIPGDTFSISHIRAANMLEEAIARVEGREKRTMSQLTDAAQGEGEK